MRVERGHRRVSRGTVGGLAIDASASRAPSGPLAPGSPSRREGGVDPARGMCYRGDGLQGARPVCVKLPRSSPPFDRCTST